MKVLRMAWCIPHIIVATFVMGGLTILTAALDHSKRYIGWWPRRWAKWILWTSGLSISVKGLEHLQPGQQYIFMSNHASALDIPIALSILPGTVVFLAKQELFRIFFFGWSLRAMGSIPVNRSNAKEAKKSVDHALEILRTKLISLILYPEGTRTRDGRLLPFKKGVFFLALKSRLPLVPMAVSGSFEAMPPGAKVMTQKHIQVTVGQPIETVGLKDQDRNSLVQDAFTSIQGLLDGPFD
ncbi:lysophospholipid acyltransferase family protein [Candidatus Neomarinimicrobiota bacterium]